MPPRFAYWTIIAGGLPTAFRATEREELLPTFQRIREKHPDAEMKWFARGKLWESPDAARIRRDDSRGRSPFGEARPPAGDKRGRDWRPGGEHRDPRQKFVDAKKQKNAALRKDRWERKNAPPREHPHAAPPPDEVRRQPRSGTRDGRDRPHENRDAPAQRPWQDRPPGDSSRRSDAKADFSRRSGAKADPRGPQARGDWRDRPPADRTARPDPSRRSDAKPDLSRRSDAKADRPWRDRPPRDGSRRSESKPDMSRRSDAKADPRAPQPRGDWRDRPPADRTARPDPSRRSDAKAEPRRPQGKSEWRPKPAGNKPPFPGGKPQFPGRKPEFAGAKPQFAARKPPFAGGNPQFPGRKPQAAGGKPQPGGWTRKPDFRGQDTEEPKQPPQPNGPNREPRREDTPAPEPPPRPDEPAVPAPGPAERGHIKSRRPFRPRPQPPKGPRR